MAEQRFCKPQVGGSIPLASSRTLEFCEYYHRIPEPHPKLEIAYRVRGIEFAANRGHMG